MPRSTILALSQDQPNQPRCLGHPGSHRRTIIAFAPRLPHAVQRVPTSANSRSTSSPCFRISCSAGMAPRCSQQVQAAARVVSLQIADHVIVGNGRWLAFGGMDCCDPDADGVVLHQA
jgi:hypothetical protein